MQPTQNKKELPTFMIRKLSKKIKNSEVFTPEIQSEKMVESDLFTSKKKPRSDSKKQKPFEHFEKQSSHNFFAQQSMIINSKIYQQLRLKFIEIKKKHLQAKVKLEKTISQQQKEREQGLFHKEQLIKQRKKYLHTYELMNQKLAKLRQTNEKYHQLTEQKYAGQSQYMANLLISMRLQGQYDHDIDPDKMTYQQLLDLEQKIGSVSRGISLQQMSLIKKYKFQKTSIRLEQQQLICTICYSNFQQGQQCSKMNCKHHFHFECLKSWLANEKKCPNCKQQIGLS